MKNDKALQAEWEKLTAKMLRKGFGHLWMSHFIATEVSEICKDPVAAKRAGFEPPHSDDAGQ